MDEILQFFKNNKDALTAIGIILTFLVSAISLYFSTRNNKAVHYVNAITKSRIEWIQKLRNLVAMYICKCTMKDKQSLSGSSLIELHEYLSEIKLMLNFSGAIDKKIISILEHLDEKTTLLTAWVNYYNEYGYSSEDDLFINFHKMAHDILFVGDYVLRKSKCFGIDYSDKTQTFCRDTYIERFIRKIEQDEELYRKLVLEFSWEMNNTVENIHKLLADLEKYTQIYLKAEWNRVKYESQYKIYEKETQEFDIWELEQKYNNPEYKNDVRKRICINAKAKAKRIYSHSGFIVFLVCIVIFVLAIFIIA